MDDVAITMLKLFISPIKADGGINGVAVLWYIVMGIAFATWRNERKLK